jgi:hypothetical protein
MSMISNLISRRKMLATAAAGGMMTAATAAQAQTADSMPQLMRPGRGGTNPGPKRRIAARFRICVFPLKTRTRAWNAPVGADR